MGFYLSPALLAAIPVAGLRPAQVCVLISRVAEGVREISEKEQLVHPTMVAHLATMLRATLEDTGD